MLNIQKILVVAMLFGPISSAVNAQDTTLPRPAKVLEISVKPVALQVQYPAIVYPSQQVELSFRVSGKVIELPVRAADQVKSGDVIAVLDTRDFKNAVAQLQSQLDQAGESLKELKAGARPEDILGLEASVNAMQAQLDQASAQVERSQKLKERGVVSQAKLDQDIAAVRVATANLQTAQEQLTIGKSGARPEDIASAEAVIRGLDAQMDQANDQLNDATLRAPFDGIIAQRHIDNFTNIKAGTDVVLLQQLTTVDMVFDIPGTDVLKWANFAKDSISITVHLSGIDTPMAATKLVEFSTQADPGTQTYRARVSMDVPKGVEVLPGMAGRVVLLSANTGTNKPQIPLTALASDPQGKAYVWVVDDNNAVSERMVTTGAMSGGTVTIDDGLKAGERIVTAGVNSLRAGAVIRPITKVGE